MLLTMTAIATTTVATNVIVSIIRSFPNLFTKFTLARCAPRTRGSTWGVNTYWLPKNLSPSPGSNCTLANGFSSLPFVFFLLTLQRYGEFQDWAIISPFFCEKRPFSWYMSRFVPAHSAFFLHFFRSEPYCRLPQIGSKSEVSAGRKCGFNT